MSTSDELFAAIEAGDCKAIEALLRREPAVLDAPNGRGDTPLLAAAYRGRPEVTALLLERGATAGLFEAAALGLKEVVVEHLRRDPGAVNSYSHDGWTPLHLAAFFGHRELADLLLERGAEVNARSRSERFARANTPLHAAAANRQVAVAELLIARGADVNARDGSGFTPLALAANSKSDLLMMLLLEHGARAD